MTLGTIPTDESPSGLALTFEGITVKFKGEATLTNVLIQCEWGKQYSISIF